MCLVSMKEMLIKAREGHYAVGQFNINNLEWTEAILDEAQALNTQLFLVYLKVPLNIWAVG